MKLLCMGDWCSFTGFGQVMTGIMKNMPSDWDIHVVGSSYNPAKEAITTPDNIKVHDAKGSSGDDFGRKRLIKFLAHSGMDFDLVFILQDSFILGQDVFSGNCDSFIEKVAKLCYQTDTKLVTYTPVDAQRPYSEWYDRLLAYSDRLVYYIDWARDTVNSVSKYDHSQADVIHHGIDLDTWEPISELEKKTLQDKWNIPRDKFTILFGGANQRRKNIPHDVMGAFAKLYQKRKDVQLIMKTSPHKGVGVRGEGWNLAKIMGEINDEYGLPQESMQFIGSESGNWLDKETVNKIINVADVVFNPGAEGWGLWPMQAMAAKVPTIVGNHSALSEIGDDGRSVQITMCDDMQGRIYFTDDWEIYRPQVNIHSFIDKTRNLMDMDDEERGEMVDRAYEYAKLHTWDEISDKWEDLFREVVSE